MSTSRHQSGRNPLRHVLRLEMAAPRELLSHEATDLRSRIEEIERMLRDAPEQELRRRGERRVTIPPPEAGRPLRRLRGGANARRLTKLEQRALARERWRQVMLSAVLVALLVGLVNWLARILQS
jgi:hypothetical protein